MTEKAMKLVDPNTGEMICKHCGSKHFASMRPCSNGRYYKGSWQCAHGCGK